MIDIGANLTNKRFIQSLPLLLERAKLCGVANIIVTGTDLESSLAALNLCQQYPQLYCTAGIHPHDASSFNLESKKQLLSLLRHPKVVAVGETGLDFNRNFSTPKQQIYAFEEQLELAEVSGKPLFLHERDAFTTQYEMLQKIRPHITGGVVHCFTGNQESLERYLALDLYIGITGWICDERRGLELQKMIKLIPDNRLLIETDSPYLTPRNLPNKIRKKKNEPANLNYIAEKISELRDQSTEHLKDITLKNTQRLFKFE